MNLLKTLILAATLTLGPLSFASGDMYPEHGDGHASCASQSDANHGSQTAAEAPRERNTNDDRGETADAVLEDG